MTALGFSYVAPERQVDDRSRPSPQSATDRAYAEQWGYGLLPVFEADRPWVDVMTVADVQAQLDGLGAQSRGEGESYNQALYGTRVPGRDEAVGQGESGCLADARTTIDESPGSLAERADRFEDSSIRFAADPRTVDLDATWSRCMNESGHDFTRPEEIRDSMIEVMDRFSRRLSSVRGSVRDSGNGPVAIAPSPEVVAAFEADLAVEADRERQLAIADLECRLPIAEAYLQLQQEFFEDVAE